MFPATAWSGLVWPKIYPPMHLRWRFILYLVLLWQLTHHGNLTSLIIIKRYRNVFTWKPAVYGMILSVTTARLMFVKKVRNNFITQRVRDIDPKLVRCWATGADGLPAINQYWVNASFSWECTKWYTLAYVYNIILFHPFSVVTDFRYQILTTEGDPRTDKIIKKKNRCRRIK